MADRLGEKPQLKMTEDPFTGNITMVRYVVMSMTVDGVSRERFQDFHSASMISIRTEASDRSGGYRYEHDGYPIDEEHFLKWNCIASTTPNEHSDWYCDDSLHS